MSAALALLICNGRVLGVSRKHDPNDWGLPGGKVEPGESAENAARRELFEETGLRAVSLIPVFVGDSRGSRTHTFLVTEWGGELTTSEEGRVGWVSCSQLGAGSFRDYNRRLFLSLAMRRGLW